MVYDMLYMYVVFVLSVIEVGLNRSFQIFEII